MSPIRKRVSSGAPWEEAVRYSRALRVGPHVHVAGTTSATPDGIVGEGDAYAQAVQCFRTIERALAEVGASMRDVVRTRIYVVDVADWQAVGRAPAEFLADARPAATLVEVSRLIDPALRVEIEVDAYVG